jgi:transglutaminase-like putative cysteine protease
MTEDRSGRVGRAIAAALPFALAATAVMALESRFRGWVFVLLLLGVAYQAVVVTVRRRHRMFGVEFAAGLLLLGLLVATFTGPRTGVLLLLPAGFAYLFVGLGLLQHESVRDRLRRALPRRRAPPDQAETAVRRDLASLGLVIPACALTLLLVPVATYTFPLRARGSARGGDDSSWRPDSGTPPEPDAQGLSGLAPPPADTPDRSLLRPAHLEIRPLVQGIRTGSVGALYLRGVPLVETGSDRWREDFSGLRPCADADDGIADEWCRVRAQPAERDALMLEVTMVVPELASTGELLLLGPPAETAFEVPRMRAKRGGPYLVPRPPTNAPFDYRVEAVLPWRIAPPGTRVVARAPAKISADDESAAASVLAEEARRAAAGVAGDVERVRAVMRHLRTGFEYEELEDRREGPTSIAEFIATRRGTCIQFAKAGVVMLRHLGIASRVGTGFLVVEWDEGRAAYVVSGRDRHAWVEVEIEGSGWVVFDPTPAAPDAAQPSPDPMSQLGGPDPPPQELRPEEPPSDSESVSDSVRLAIEDVCRFLGGLWRRATEYWPVVAIAALVAAALAAHSMLARRTRLSGAPRAAPAGRGPWESLVAELARRGHHRRLSQTASEFARAVAAAGGAPLAPFVPLTARREAARFGGLDLTPADETAIDSFRASLPPR